MPEENQGLKAFCQLSMVNCFRKLFCKYEMISHLGSISYFFVKIQTGKNENLLPFPIPHSPFPKSAKLLVFFWHYSVPKNSLSATCLNRRNCASISALVKEAAKVLKPNLIKGLGISNSNRFNNKVPSADG